ncbi:hypothetical protein PMAC_002560 [Pneumocystis sp. 'macacae']|nr:hypothetical protein PMAC_002560 [Pneumocystis sp. 'macacae']
MAQVYSQEPYTNGKVCINTNKGNIEIELWGKETPKACRNFIQLCMEGYYDNTIFHRLVPGFIIQGGDPTGTGMGGQSIWDGPFSDEFHSRLRYNRRGLVGMANSGKNNNGSQFFITLSPTPELQGKNTLFGRIVGDSIYNVLRMAELEVDKNERPLYPPKIISTKILLNPFDDILPRITEKERIKQIESLIASKQEFKNKVKKNKTLLSFQDETDTDTSKEFKLKSSHDIGNDSKLSEIPAITANVKRKYNSSDKIEKSESFVTNVKNSEAEVMSPLNLTNSFSELSEKKKSSDSKKIKIDEIQAQIDILKKDIKSIGKKKNGYLDTEKNEKEKLFSYLERERERYKASEKAIVGGKGKSIKKREEETLAKLSLFQSKISSKDCIEVEYDEEKDACELHSVPGCFSCFDRLGEHNDLPEENNSDWFAKKLIFAKDKLGKDHTYSAKKAEEDFEIIDPRERKERAISEEKMRKKNNEISKSFKPNYKGYKSNL